MGSGFGSLRSSPSSLVATLPLLLDLIDRRLSDAVRGGPSILLRGDAHLYQ
jgi:hypothetical protein